MEVAKGQSFENGAYLYTCGSCAGSGKVRGELCTSCYALDADRISAEMKQARGARYYALLKAFLSVRGRSIVTEALRIKGVQDGKLNPADLGYLTLQYGINFKALIEWLRECRVIRPEFADMDNWKSARFTMADGTVAKFSVTLVQDEGRKKWAHLLSEDRVNGHSS